MRRLKKSAARFCLRWAIHLALAVVFLYYVFPGLCRGFKSTFTGIFG